MRSVSVFRVGDFFVVKRGVEWSVDERGLWLVFLLENCAEFENRLFSRIFIMRFLNY